jgi:hypothetical protein
MLGFMTAREARAIGFTHHASYYGLPLWLMATGDDGVSIAAKWAPLDYLIPLFTHIEQFIRSVMFPDDEPCFQFVVGEEL